LSTVTRNTLSEFGTWCQQIDLPQLVDRLYCPDIEKAVLAREDVWCQLADHKLPLIGQAEQTIADNDDVADTSARLAHVDVVRQIERP
jgi:hypothetical protein